MKVVAEFFEMPWKKRQACIWGIRAKKLTVYPKGNVKFKGKALSVFLELVEADKLPPKRKAYAEYKLRVRNQISDNHKEFSGKSSF
ncbi:hypothetical protein V6N13_045988 [Hibiscus sabdariffa]